MRTVRNAMKRGKNIWIEMLLSFMLLYISLFANQICENFLQIVYHIPSIPGFYDPDGMSTASHTTRIF
jgi:hypothetical protein